ncbi:MAG: NUDIX hydrolase [Pseudomonadales bacterium]|nr:NUDIX hydrolase [Pseudomonadales bacterium]
MKFCSECGAKVIKKICAPDNRERYCCTSCNTIHYQNPKVLVSCYATWEDKILWIRRNTQPCKGLWSAPSGFLEEGEDLETAAARELYEETHAEIDRSRMQLHMVGNLRAMNQIYIVYRAPLVKPDFCTTEEASEVRLFRHAEFPIDDFAYPEVADNVELIYRELQNKQYDVHTGVLEGDNNIVRTVDRKD